MVNDFAGADPETTVVADEAAALLTECDRRVRHYELAAADFVEGLRKGRGFVS